MPKIVHSYDAGTRVLSIRAVVRNKGVTPRGKGRLTVALLDARGTRLASTSASLPRVRRRHDRSLRLKLQVPVAALGAGRRLRVCAGLPRRVRDRRPKDNCRTKTGVELPAPPLLPILPAAPSEPVPAPAAPAPTEPVPPAADTTAPDTGVLSGPSGTVATAEATFTYSGSPSSDADHFECRIDAASFAVCPATGKSFSSLADGAHRFDVRAIDAAGNADATPASRTWTVDTTAPETDVLSGPSTAISSTNATFTYSGTPSADVDHFECRRDAESFADCDAAGKSYAGVAEGAHTFVVRAVDAVGNADPSPATRSWSVDTTAPETTITAAPPANSSVPAAEFSFTSSETSTFHCSLNGAAFVACSSAWSVTVPASFVSSFRVRAMDGVGNADPSPATFAWTFALGDASNIRAHADGAISEGVNLPVTYVKPAVGAEPAGFFVQGSASTQQGVVPGEGIFVAVDPATLSPVPVAGDPVSFTATAVATVNGMRRVTSLADWTIRSGHEAVYGLLETGPVVDLSNATNIDAHESELMSFGMTVADVLAPADDFDLAQITTAGTPSPSANLVLRTPSALHDDLALASGCSVGLRPVPLWRNGTQAQPTAWVASDISSITC